MEIKPLCRERIRTEMMRTGIIFYDYSILLTDKSIAEPNILKNGASTSMRFSDMSELS